MLAGGNALGAYQAGVWEALADAGVEPDRIAGTSVGAINGAVIAGNPPERRLERLRALWRPGARDWWDFTPDTWRRSGEALATLIGGHDALFGGVASGLGEPTPALYDSRPLAATLERLVDFERLNERPIRYACAAVVLEDGADALFDTALARVGPEHVRASAAMPPAFPAVEVEGRLYVDGGLSRNLPVDAITDAEAPLLVIAVDLLPLRQHAPATLGESIARAQDLAFACQSRRGIGALEQRGSAVPLTLVRLAYADQAREVAGKTMDFSGATVAERWASGLADGRALIARLAAGGVPFGAPGVTVVEA